LTLLRMKDLRALEDEDLRRRIGEIENDLLRERGIAAMGGAPPSPGRMRALRTNVARALTVLNERRRRAPAAVRPPPRAAAKAPAPLPPKTPRARTARSRAPRAAPA
jgi:large subunit ribosomal protein L29